MIKSYNDIGKLQNYRTPKGTRFTNRWAKILKVETNSTGSATTRLSILYGYSPYLSLYIDICVQYNNGSYMTKTTNAYLHDYIISKFDYAKRPAGIIVPLEEIKVGFIEDSDNPKMVHIYITNSNISGDSSVISYLNTNPFITILGDSNDNISATNTTTVELQDTDLTDSDMDKIVDLSIIKGPDAMALRSEYTIWPGDKLVFKNLSVRSDNLYHCIFCSHKPNSADKYYDFYIVLRYLSSESEDIQIYTFGEKVLAASSIIADFEDETKTTYILTINLPNNTYWIYNFSILN